MLGYRNLKLLDVCLRVVAKPNQIGACVMCSYVCILAINTLYTGSRIS
jgi:hypothetical protein